MRANIYIDGFNLYYGCLRGTKLKWLDPSVLSQLLLPSDEITHIRYFTARVSPRPNDPDAPQRQQIYLRALATIPNLTVHYGSFLTKTVSMPLAEPPPTGSYMVDVIKTEEKGSDVNLATHLLVDAFQGQCDVAAVVSNDSDLAEPIRIVRDVVGKPVGVINPHIKRRPSAELRNVATFVKAIRQSALKRSQFPETLTDANGEFRAPRSW